ncbi:MAG TPA: hypothetical protein VFB01_16020 [Burkholderiales bacterium]|nr:hypothetical protein [Burkholderiales bacterium]
MKKIVAARAALLAALLAAASTGAHAQGARAPSPFGTGSQTSQPPADWRASPRESTVAPAQTPPNPAVPPNPCMTTKVQGATPPNPCTPQSAARGAVAQRVNAPRLSISFARPAFAVAQSCQAGVPLLSLKIVIANTGTVPYQSPAYPLAIVARDQAKVSWQGQAPLPSLPAGASKAMSVPVFPPTYAPRAAGTHQFVVSAPFAGSTQPVTVTLPANVCGSLAQRFKSTVVLGAAKAAPAQVSAVKTPPAQTSAMGHPKGPQPPVPMGMAGKLGVLVGPPTNVTSTVDPKTCADHGGLGGGLACTALLPQGRMALVWSWSGAAADGFNVYRVDGGQQVRTGRQANGKEATVYIVDPVPAGGYAGKCYAVSAYRGSDESPLSAPFCTDGGNVVQTAVITVGHARAVGQWKDSDGGGGVTDGGSYAVGYWDLTFTHALGDNHSNTFDRLALFFDTSAVSHRKIYGARLKLTVDSTIVGEGPFQFDHYTSCASRIGTGLDRWWNHGDWIQASEVLAPGRYQGPDVALDVTKIVQQWAQFPDANFGLVLMGENEDLSAFLYRACQTTYDPTRISLEVEFY